MGGSTYSKPNLTVHVINVYCIGSEESIVECIYTSLSLDDGKALLGQVEVAGVSCQQENACEIHPTGGNNCSPGDVRLVAKDSTTHSANSATSQGNLEYCYKGLWSSVCSISKSAATVACKQMGFTKYSCKYRGITSFLVYRVIVTSLTRAGKSTRPRFRLKMLSRCFKHNINYKELSTFTCLLEKYT